jgi:pilus assembly protein CpaE
MSESLQALVALDDEVDRGLIDALVAGSADVAVLDYVDIGGPTASGFGAGDVLIVAFSDYTTQVREYVGEAARQHPGRPVVLLSPAAGNGFLRDAFSSGVDDVVALPPDSQSLAPEFIHELSFALEKAVVRRGRAVGDRRSAGGRLICVLGLKGGSGKTLTVVNLGVALADDGYRVALVDLDLQFGDLALAMGLAPERTIFDLVRSAGSLDAGKLDDFMVVHPSGARALVSPVRPDQAALVKVPLVREVLRLLQDKYDYVVVDTPPNFTAEVIAAIDMSNDVLMVATRDALALKNTKLGLETLARMDYDRDAVKVLLNRANTKVGINPGDILAVLGREVDLSVPSHRDVTCSVNEGSPIVLRRGASAGKAFRRLAKLYEDDGHVPMDASHAGSDGASPRPPAEAPAAPSAAKERRRLFRRGR